MNNYRIEYEIIKNKRKIILINDFISKDLNELLLHFKKFIKYKFENVEVYRIINISKFYKKDKFIVIENISKNNLVEEI